jgi:hypothetical protein
MVPWNPCFIPAPVLNSTYRSASNSKQLLLVSSRGTDGESRTVPCEEEEKEKDGWQRNL